MIRAAGIRAERTAPHITVDMEMNMQKSTVKETKKKTGMAKKTTAKKAASKTGAAKSAIQNGCCQDGTSKGI